MFHLQRDLLLQGAVCSIRGGCRLHHQHLLCAAVCSTADQSICWCQESRARWEGSFDPHCVNTLMKKLERDYSVLIFLVDNIPICDCLFFFMHIIYLAPLLFVVGFCLVLLPLEFWWYLAWKKKKKLFVVVCVTYYTVCENWLMIVLIYLDKWFDWVACIASFKVHINW